MIVTAPRTSVFALPHTLDHKSDPTLIADDDTHFAAIAASLQHSIDDLSERLDLTRRSPAGQGENALNRDQEIHRLTARLRTLRRFGLDLCLGRFVIERGSTIYIGRLGLVDADLRQLLIDWRSPAAEPFFAATHGSPMGLTSRRRYRWTNGKITDYWDEVFAADALQTSTALDDQSAFIASLGASRSPRMQDVLATIQSDQDAVIRAGSSGTLVVDGGPGTGKTVVALHRAAYLLYADPRLGQHRGGILFVGPHQPYLAYVADVLPSLGEDGVQTCTLRDLLPEGAAATPEIDPGIAGLKASTAMIQAVETAVRFYGQPPTSPLVVTTEWADVRLAPADWTDAFDAADPGTPHNEAREVIWQAVLSTLVDKHDEDVDEPALRAALAGNRELGVAFNRAWPLLDATDVVSDLWSVPAFLRYCAPWLRHEEIEALQRSEPTAWTTADLPILDAARQRLGDPESTRRQRQREATLRRERAEMDQVVEHLIEADDSELLVMTMLRGQDLRNALVDEDAAAVADPDVLAGPFAHVVVDEAQELTDAEWHMLTSRCPSGSFTVVGDRAQARHGFHESWRERLDRVGLRHITMSRLTVNYRTPEEVMAEAEPVIRAALPDANVPTSVRSTGVPVQHAALGDLDEIVRSWLAEHPEGTVCVIGSDAFRPRGRVRSLTPALVKGLEFDLVVLVDPAAFGVGIEGAVDRYVAMTRATRQLVVLS